MLLSPRSPLDPILRQVTQMVASTSVTMALSEQWFLFISSGTEWPKFWNHCSRESGPALSLPYPKYVHMKTVKTLGLLSVFPGLITQAHILQNMAQGASSSLWNLPVGARVLASSLLGCLPWPAPFHTFFFPEMNLCAHISLIFRKWLTSPSPWDALWLGTSWEGVKWRISIYFFLSPLYPPPSPFSSLPSHKHVLFTLGANVLDAGAVNRRHHPCPEEARETNEQLTEPRLCSVVMESAELKIGGGREGKRPGRNTCPVKTKRQRGVLGGRDNTEKGRESMADVRNAGDCGGWSVKWTVSDHGGPCRSYWGARAVSDGNRDHRKALNKEVTRSDLQFRKSFTLYPVMLVSRAHKFAWCHWIHVFPRSLRGSWLNHGRKPDGQLVRKEEEGRGIRTESAGGIGSGRLLINFNTLYVRKANGQSFKNLWHN